MRGGARQPVLPTSLARDSDSSSMASQVTGGGFNASVAQRVLRARGGFGVKGRIAKCPRLQQKPSDRPITELAVFVSYSSPLRGEKPMAVANLRVPASAFTRTLPSMIRDAATRAAARRVVHWCLTASWRVSAEKIGKSSPFLFSKTGVILTARAIQLSRCPEHRSQHSYPCPWPADPHDRFRRSPLVPHPTRRSALLRSPPARGFLNPLSR